jgi:hypothetical protein
MLFIYFITFLIITINLNYYIFKKLFLNQFHNRNYYIYRLIGNNFYMLLIFDM